jgi:hypothetical protein
VIGLIIKIKLCDGSEKHELLSHITHNLVWYHFQHIEVDSFAQRSTFTNPHNITFLDGESRGTMHGDVPVTLLVSVVLGNVVEIVTTYHNGSLHFGGDDDSLEDFPSDGYSTGEWALLVYVVVLDGFFWSSES